MILPADIIRYIACFEEKQGLNNLRHVCKCWANALTFEKFELWGGFEHVDVRVKSDLKWIGERTHSIYLLNRIFIETIPARGIKHMVIHDAKWSKSQIDTFIVENNSQLQSFECCIFYSEEIIDYFFSRVADTRPQIKKIMCLSQLRDETILNISCKCKELKYLRLDEISDVALMYIAQNCSNLKEFVYYDSVSRIFLQELTCNSTLTSITLTYDCSDKILDIISKNCPSIEKLNLTVTCKESNLINLAKSCKRLKYLTLNFIYLDGYLDNFIRELTYNAVQLQYIYLTKCPLKCNSKLQLFRRCKNIRRIIILQRNHWDKVETEIYLTSMCKKLEYLIF